MTLQRLFLLIALTVAATSGLGAAHGQTGTAQEITFFSNPGMSGARFTVTGPRTNLSIPYEPRSAALQGGGSWQICSETDYRGKCLVIAATMRELNFGPVRSIRRLDTTTPAPSPWKEIARLDVRDRADRDTVGSTDRCSLFREIKVCSERNTIRIRRAEVQLGNGQWQRLFVPLALEQGRCSDDIKLLGNVRRIRAVRFKFEAWTLGIARGIISVKALPHVQVQPR